MMVARSPGKYSTGTVAGGIGNTPDMYDAIIAEMATIQSNSEDAWELIDTLGVRNLVFHSVGNRELGAKNVDGGDVDMFVQIELSGLSIELTAFHDWSTMSSTGSRASVTVSSSFDNVSAMTWHSVSNEYESTWIVNQAASWKLIGFGAPTKWASPQIDGVARITNSPAGTGSVSFNLDRDIQCRILAGKQRIWIVNRTPRGDALAADNVEVVPVSFVDSGSITLTGIQNASYEVGSLIGLDPSPNYVFASTVGNPIMRMCTFGDGTPGAADIGTIRSGLAAITESQLDPDASGLYHGYRGFIQQVTAGQQTIRGVAQHLAFFTFDGAVVDGDRMLPGYDPTQAYKVFPSISGTYGANPGVPGIGPGAL